MYTVPCVPDDDPGVGDGVGDGVSDGVGDGVGDGVSDGVGDGVGDTGGASEPTTHTSAPVSKNTSSYRIPALTLIIRETAEGSQGAYTSPTCSRARSHTQPIRQSDVSRTTRTSVAIAT